MNILITGCARSGTTLLLLLMKGCRGVRVIDDQEMHPGKLSLGEAHQGPIVIKKPQGFDNPHIDFGKYFWRKDAYLEQHINNWKIIFCIRDGRDVITSRHYLSKNSYWVKPTRWIHTVRRSLKYTNHTNAFFVHYESIVTQPQIAMDNITKWLSLAYDYSWINQFYKRIKPDNNLSKALNSLRPIDQNSIGQWRKPEHQKQILWARRRWGRKFDQLLGELNYSTDWD